MIASINIESVYITGIQSNSLRLVCNLLLLHLQTKRYLGLKPCFYGEYTEFLNSSCLGFLVEQMIFNNYKEDLIIS